MACFLELTKCRLIWSYDQLVCSVTAARPLEVMNRIEVARQGDGQLPHRVDNASHITRFDLPLNL